MYNVNKIIKSCICCFWILLIVSVLSCEKLVEIDPPVNTIGTEGAFADYTNANAAVAGVYSSLFSKQLTSTFGNGWITIYCGIAADELLVFSPFPESDEFYLNAIRPQNFLLLIPWNQAYSIIYQTNACIEGLNSSKGIPEKNRQMLLAEAKFLRAFCYFQLINLFGDVPYITTIDWRENMVFPRTKVDEIRKEMINDLKGAIEYIPDDYAVYGGQRVRATKWAVYTLLTKILLLDKKWEEAEQYANLVISNSSQFDLVAKPSEVFFKNSKETILQWHNFGEYPPFNILPEGMMFIPYSNSSNPNFYLSAKLVNEFDSIDFRLRDWVGITTYLGNQYYYPFKYKVGPAEATPGGPVNEYYTVFRLADLILLRAEARINLGNLPGAIEDINRIRFRAGIAALNLNDRNQVALALLNERRKELFCEWGSRWFDLIRTGFIDSVMSEITSQKGGAWESYKQLLPINSTELSINPLSTQNPGYN